MLFILLLQIFAKNIYYYRSPLFFFFFIKITFIFFMFRDAPGCSGFLVLSTPLTSKFSNQAVEQETKIRLILKLENRSCSKDSQPTFRKYAETSVKTLLNSVGFTLRRDLNLYYQGKVNDIVETVRIRQFLPLIFST